MSQAILKKIIKKKMKSPMYSQKNREWNRWWWYRIEDEITDENYKRQKVNTIEEEFWKSNETI